MSLLIIPPPACFTEIAPEPIQCRYLHFIDNAGERQNSERNALTYTLVFDTLIAGKLIGEHHENTINRYHT